MQCTTPDCAGLVHARKLCRRCYNRQYASTRYHSAKRRNDVVNSFAVEFKVKATVCQHPGDLSPRPHYANGRCRSCYDKEAYKQKRLEEQREERAHEARMQMIARGELAAPAKLTAAEYMQLKRAAQTPKPKPVVLEPDFGPPEEDME